MLAQKKVGIDPKELHELLREMDIRWAVTANTGWLSATWRRPQAQAIRSLTF